jgi:hypothetical protein
MENQIKWTEKPVQSNLISKIGATVLLLLSVGVTFAIPSLFMLIFMHHSFMMQFYICENVVIFLQRVDLWAKRFNEKIKDGKGVVLFFNFMRPLARAAADQLVELNREMKSPKPEEAKEAEVKTEEAPKAEEAKSERKYF